MARILWTDSQREAVETLNRNVLVSAAAGAGKTAVLAERCAYLVCDAPSELQCDVDRLLVVTFTEAAASEMRERIVNAIRDRLEARPADVRLREQADRVETAQISTLHAFCLWCIRRWFSELAIDPQAEVLDEDEDALLRRDVLDGLFSTWYAQSLEAPTAPAPLDHSMQWAQDFAGFVEDYGLGDDRDIAEFILRLSAFLDSLPDPDEWLRQAEQDGAIRPRAMVARLKQELVEELEAQIDECAHRYAGGSDAVHPAAQYYRRRIQNYQQGLRQWLTELQSVPEAAAADALGVLDAVAKSMFEFSFGDGKAPRLSRDCDPTMTALRDAAREDFERVKERLYEGRLKSRFARFTVNEWLDGLARMSPHVRTIVQIVRTFREAFRLRRRRENLLNFGDLERLTYELLTDADRPGEASDVARRLRDRFAHVLVDEFQDINPLQQAILESISREPGEVRTSRLFAVGDIKQSIYRFRLAEPDLFLERMNRLRAGPGNGQLVFLRENFRSRKSVLDAVNFFFSRWMRPRASKVIYDQDAFLVSGRRESKVPIHEPIEVHILEQRLTNSEQDLEDLEPGIVDPDHAGAWTSIEREAFLIGQKILEWIERPAGRDSGGAYRFRDIVILLRSAQGNAARMSGILASMGIPVFADVGGSLLDAREIQDVTAALQVFDNPRQDIPLAAVLRSGIVGAPLDDEALALIRCWERDVSFHEVVYAYGERGPDPRLREQVATILRRIDRFRDEFRRRPIAEVLWDLYERHGFLAYVCGLPRGAQREANLLRLHEWARRFGAFRRQGLHRFLGFLESMKAKERAWSCSPPVSEQDDVVRIMSIHRSKGLEFPIVFVAGLGTRFNLKDREGRLVFERKARIGLRVVDRKHLVEYPSAAHVLAALEIERRTREEELRILYVAMTRAREKLVLVGSRRQAGRVLEREAATVATGISRLQLVSAGSALDWIVPTLQSAPQGTVNLGRCDPKETALFTLFAHENAEIREWRLEDRPIPGDSAARRAVSAGLVLPEAEPLATDAGDVERIERRIRFLYPYLASASVRAVVTASEFKGSLTDDEYTRSFYIRGLESREGALPCTPDKDREPASSKINSLENPPSPPPTGLDFDAARRERAIRRGVVTHRVLQALDFSAAMDPSGLGSELRRLTASGWISSDDLGVLDEHSLNWFVLTPLAQAIRSNSHGYRREFSYLAADRPEYFDSSLVSLPDDFVLVRGVIDGILATESDLAIIDFKTDEIREQDVPARTQWYRPQMELYARATASIWKRPVTGAWLVFLSACRLVHLPMLKQGESRA